MRILMVNRSVTEDNDTTRIMLRLAQSLRALGHEIYFFATEDRRGSARRRRTSELPKWRRIGTWGFKLVMGKASRQVSHVTRVSGEAVAEETGEKPLPTAEHAGTYLVTRKRVTLFNARSSRENEEVARHLGQFLLQVPVEAALVFDAYGALTWTTVAVLKEDFHLPVWVVCTDLKAVCPAGDRLCRGRECHRCGITEVPRDEKKLKTDDGIARPSFRPCALHRCVNGSFWQSLLAAREASMLRSHTYCDMPDGYMAPSGYHQRLLMEANFTLKDIVSVDVPLAPEDLHPMRRERSGFMLYIGGLNLCRGLETLIRALSMSINNEYMVLCGEGPDRHLLESYAEHLGVRDRVRFMGSLKAVTLRKLMAEATCLVVPSECEELAPWGLLQMQALGKAAIVADHSVLTDRVVDHRTGLVFETGNAGALAQAMDEMHDMSDEELRRMGDNAAEDARRRYEPEQYARRVLELLCGDSGFVSRRTRRRGKPNEA